MHFRDSMATHPHCVSANQLGGEFPIRILLIEDSPLDARIIEHAFQHQGACIDRATTLSLGEDRLRAQTYDLVLLDLLLPDSSGLDKIARLQSISPETPIIIVSGVEDEFLARRARQLGADDFICKSRYNVPVINRAARQALDRARARRDLLQSERWLKAICAASRDGILVEHNDRIVFANQSCAELFGFAAPSELTGFTLSELCLPTQDGPGQATHTITECDSAYELTGKRRDGASIPLEASTSTFELQGKHYRITVFRDIRARKQMDSDLRLAEFALDQAPDAITWLDPEGRYLYTNQSFSRLTGFTKQELEKTSVFELDPSLTAAAWRQSWESLRNGEEETISTGIREKSGQVVPVEIRTRRIQQEGREFCLAFSRDVRRRIAEEQALRELVRQNQSLYESERAARVMRDALIEASRALTASLDFEKCLRQLLSILRGVIPYDNACVMLTKDGSNYSVYAYDGYENWEGKRISEICFSAEKNEIFREMTANLQSIMIPDTASDPRWERIAGSEAIRSWIGVPLVEQGKLLGIYSLDKDTPGFFTREHLHIVEALAAQASITLHNARLHQALLHSEERFRKLFENATDWNFTTDLQGRITTSNPAGTRISGYSGSELIGCDLAQFAAPSAQDTCNEILTRARSGESVSFSELRMNSKTGAELTLEVNARVVRVGETPSCIQFAARDVSVRKRLEESLRRARHLESIGRLAGGVAHDFNNLLMVIRGYVDILLEDSALSEEKRGPLDEIRIATARATHLTRQLLTVGRKQIRRPEDIDMRDSVRTACNLAKQNSTVEIHFTDASPDAAMNVRMDREQLQQVVQTLISNAQKACSKGGVVSVRLERASTDLRQTMPLDLTASHSYALLSVADTAAVIPADRLPNVFEPFFMARDRSTAGLELATLYAIVKQANGHATVESSEQAGTAFRVWLPLSAQPADLPKNVAAGPQPRSDHATILLVEDEPALQRLTAHLLTQLGYTVLSACDGESALALAKHPEPIDLLLTDVIMPRMNGRAVAEAVSQIRPGIRVLYMSGYSDQILAQRGCLVSGIDLLEKPFTKAKLIERLQQILGGTAVEKEKIPN